MAKYIDSKGKMVTAHRVCGEGEMPRKKEFNAVGQHIGNIPIANIGDWRVNGQNYISDEDFRAKYHRPVRSERMKEAKV